MAPSNLFCPVSVKRRNPQSKRQPHVSRLITPAAGSVVHPWIRRSAERPEPSVVTVAVRLIGMNTGICPDGHRLMSRPAKCAGAPSTPIKGGIAPAPVMGRPGPGRLVCSVDRDIIGYCSAIAQARRMMKLGIISLEDFEKIDRVLLQKYNLTLSSLFRDKALLYR